GALLVARACEAAAAARPAFDAWAAERTPIVAMAGTIIENLEQYRGKWIEGRCSCLNRTLGEETDELNGDGYRFDYDPALRDQLLGALERLDGVYHEMAVGVEARHGVGSGLSTTKRYIPADVRYLCEIVGTAQHTPRREVRDQAGRLVGTVEG